MNDLPKEISNFFLAMQAGPHGIDLLASMFASDALYDEPFSGQAGPHAGRDAIISAFTQSRTEAFADAVIQLGAVEVDGETITVEWTCISDAIPGGQGSGTNVFTIKDGLISKLVTTLDMGAPT